ncbi:MAG TPA: hypothetical protein VIB98_08255 [Gemmatimonadaceae bacterium]
MGGGLIVHLGAARDAAKATRSAMHETVEHDKMVCRACGNEERASEGYPCADCGTFLCLICTFKGVTLCTACEAKQKDAGAKE